MRTSRRIAVSTVLATTLAVSGPVGMAFALPKPRVEPLKPRVVTLQPRIVDITPKKEKNTYTVDSDVLFSFGSAKLTSDSKAVLDDVAAKLRSDGARRATVTGYTDSIGSTSSNVKLSTARAKAVRDHLAGQAGGIRYTATGKGERNPVAANKKKDGSDNPRGRRENRRVTVTYTKS